MRQARHNARGVGVRLLVAAMLVLPTALTSLAGPSPVAALENGVARTPPMGFNDWYSFGCNITAQNFRDTADLFVSTGLRDAGYKYINIDDCWMTGRDLPRTDPAKATAGRDPVTLKLIPDPAYFPDVDQNGNGMIDPSEKQNGIKALADYIHARGLKIGIYSSAGTTTCQGLAGSLGYEQIDAQTWADWGIDYVKIDTCGAHSVTTLDGRTYSYPDTVAGYQARFTAMSDALLATGRPMVYSICDFTTSGQTWTWGTNVGNLWRTTGDVTASFASLLSTFKQNIVLGQYAGPGHWNDPDILQVGNGTGYSPIENRTQFSLWSMMAAPLLIGADLRVITADAMSVHMNTDVIAIDQDALGVQAKIVAQSGGSWVLAKPLANGDVAVALFNAGNTAATISTTVADVTASAGVAFAKRPAFGLTDLWTKALTATTGTISATVPAHGTAVYRLSDAPGAASAAPAVTLAATANKTSLNPGDTAKVTVSLTNNSKVAVNSISLGLTAPDGWTVNQTTKPAKNTLPPHGGSATATFVVTAPASAGAPISTVSLTASASYYSDAGGTQTATTPVDLTLFSPVQAPYLTANTTGTASVFGQLGPTLAISAAGTGVQAASSFPFGASPASDQYGAIYKAGVTGSVQATVVVQGGGASGVMMRNDMDANGTPVGVAFTVSPAVFGGGYSLSMAYNTTGGDMYNASLGGGFGPGGPPPSFNVPITLKLQRSGTTYTGSYSTNGTTWTTFGSVTVDASAAAASQDAGVFQTSGTAGSLTLASFSDFSVN